MHGQYIPRTSKCQVLWVIPGLGLEDEDEAGGGVTEGGLELDLGFLERFLLGGDDFFDLTNDEIAGNEF